MHTTVTEHTVHLLLPKTLFIPKNSPVDKVQIKEHGVAKATPCLCVWLSVYDAVFAVRQTSWKKPLTLYQS